MRNKMNFVENNSFDIWFLISTNESNSSIKTIRLTIGTGHVSFVFHQTDHFKNQSMIHIEILSHSPLLKY